MGMRAISDRQLTHAFMLAISDRRFSVYHTMLEKVQNASIEPIPSKPSQHGWSETEQQDGRERNISHYAHSPVLLKRFIQPFYFHRSTSSGATLCAYATGLFQSCWRLCVQCTVIHTRSGIVSCRLRCKPREGTKTVRN